MTVPAIPAMPQLISANNSPRGEPHQIRADQERRLDMADKDVHRGAEAERAADPDRAAGNNPGGRLARCAATHPSRTAGWRAR